MKTLLIRGETLGIATDIVKLMDGEGAEYTVYPALYTWAGATKEAIMTPIQGKKTVGQSLEDWLKGTSSAYRAGLAIIRKKGEKNSFNRNMSKYRNLYYEFKDEVMPASEDRGDRILTTKSKFYRELKDVFYMGNADEAARQYVVTVYGLATNYWKNEVDNKGNHTKYFDYSDAVKMAVRQVKSKMTKMNPNILSLTRKKPIESAKFVNWLNKDLERGKVYMSELTKLEREYWAKKRKVEQLISKYMRDPEALKLIAQASI